MSVENVIKVVILGVVLYLVYILISTLISGTLLQLTAIILILVFLYWVVTGIRPIKE